MLFWSAILLGLGGNLHCMGMCGPLVLAIPFGNEKGIKKILATTVYFITKALGYALLGAIIGIIGAAAKLVVWQQWISIASGILMLVMVLFPIVLQQFEKVNISASFISSNLNKLLQSKSKWRLFAFGFLHAFLPCGLVYTALAASLAFASAIKSSLFMFTFGISSALMLWALASFKTHFSFHKSKHFAWISRSIVVLVAILLIVRGLNLGIPYISPHFDQKTGEVKSCCQAH